MRQWVKLLPAGLAIAAASGCLGFGFDEVTVHHAKPDGRKISVPDEASMQGGLADTSTWPRACSMIDNREIRAIFPQAKAIHRHSGSYKAKVGPGGAAPGSMTETTQTVVGGTCEIKFDLPNKKGDHGNGQLLIHMQVVGTPDVIKRNVDYSADKPLTLNEGEDACGVGGIDIECRKHDVAFTTEFNGKDVLYKGAKSHDYEDQVAFANKRVKPAFAKTMVAKIP